MASSDTFSIAVLGRGGHAAMPNLAIDPVLIGSQIVVALQSVVSRATDPTKAAVLSVTTFKAGTAHNVIPDRAVLVTHFKAFLGCFRSVLGTTVLLRRGDGSHVLACPSEGSFWRSSEGPF
jgi:hippurate hydrolase